METVRDVDELGADSKFITGFAHAAFQNRAHVKLFANLADVFGFALENK